jgi:hypothetical protein
MPSNNILQSNLAYLADRTGGLAYDNGNDLNWGLDRVLDDQAGYYLLGYHPPDSTLNSKNSRSDFHRIQVKVTRAGCTCARGRGFSARPTSRRYRSSLADRTIARGHVVAVPVLRGGRAADGAICGGSQARSGGPQSLRINAADLTWKHDDHGNDWAQDPAGGGGHRRERPAAGEGEPRLRYTGGARKDGRSAAAWRIVHAGRAGSEARGVPDSRGGAGPGDGQDRLGHAVHPDPGFEEAGIRAGQRHPAGCRKSPDKPNLPGIAAALREFKRGGSLEFLCAVENGRKKGPDVDLATRVRVLRDGKEVYSAPARLIDVPGSGRGCSAR